MASIGESGPVSPVFTSAVDVPGAGVLCAIPALVVNGLLRGVGGHLTQPPGYYPLPALMLLFAFLALARVRSLERIRYLPPGEWGRMLGLDRIPEVKTLREKLEAISQPLPVAKWAEEMSAFWMGLDENLAGVLYIDGHVRTYTGNQTVMPRRHSSRERLCLRSVMDYWVNDTHGTPFFVVTAMGNEGMLHHLRTVIVPRLLREIPGQPTEAELSVNPDLHRFVLVFDREGWSPAFFAELWRHHRIAVQTYRRGNYEPWPVEAFTEQAVPGAYGNTTRMWLAERDMEHPDCAATADGQPAVRLREIRRLCDGKDHQTSIVVTRRIGKMLIVAGHMFARWLQENFFKYGTREFSIDQLAGYAPAEAPGNETIKNPACVALDAQLRKIRSDLAAVDAEMGRLVLDSNDPAVVGKFLMDRKVFAQRRDLLAKRRLEILATRKPLDKRIPISSLPDEQRPRFIAPSRTLFLNTLRIAAYRAETAMAIELRNHIARSDDARSLLQDVFKHDADIITDLPNKTLTVRLHHFTNPQASRAIAALLVTLTQTETTYPGTDLVLRYEMVSKPSPTGQEV